jgi:hypothetical protein
MDTVKASDFLGGFSGYGAKLSVAPETKPPRHLIQRKRDLSKQVTERENIAKQKVDNVLDFPYQGKSNRQSLIDPTRPQSIVSTNHIQDAMKAVKNIAPRNKEEEENFYRNLIHSLQESLNEDYSTREMAAFYLSDESPEITKAFLQAVDKSCVNTKNEDFTFSIFDETGEE